MAEAEIKIVLLQDGTARISSTFMGRFDSMYAPKPDANVPAEVQKLLSELRAQLAEVSLK